MKDCMRNMDEFLFLFFYKGEFRKNIVTYIIKPMWWTRKDSGQLKVDERLFGNNLLSSWLVRWLEGARLAICLVYLQGRGRIWIHHLHFVKYTIVPKLDDPLATVPCCRLESCALYIFLTILIIKVTVYWNFIFHLILI